MFESHRIPALRLNVFRMREKIASLQGIWPTALVFVLVVGGIYLGWFSPTEGAAIGAAAVGLLAVTWSAGMRWPGHARVLCWIQRRPRP